jgi:triphosphoribosyl-dephospho-CoA synthetase
MAAAKGKIALKDVGVGRIIRDCVADISAWQSGGNTLLGTIILFTPLAVAAGMTKDEKGVFNLHVLRRNLKKLLRQQRQKMPLQFMRLLGLPSPAVWGRLQI